MNTYKGIQREYKGNTKGILTKEYLRNTKEYLKNRYKILAGILTNTDKKRNTYKLKTTKEYLQDVEL
jgi:hypothetical protein